MVEIANGFTARCALLESGTAHCWGDGANGRLGNQSAAIIGDDEPVAAGASVDLGGKKAVQVCEGCALLEDGTVRCWGPFGRLSFGSQEHVGDNEPAQEVELGGEAESIACGQGNTCVVMSGGTGVRCWGGNLSGSLGYGRTEPLGDDPDELPSMLGDVPLGL